MRHPVFRRLWIASAISGTCVAAHNNAATYVLNSLSGNPALLSLIPVVTACLSSSLPFLLECLLIASTAKNYCAQSIYGWRPAPLAWRSLTACIFLVLT